MAIDVGSNRIGVGGACFTKSDGAGRIVWSSLVVSCSSEVGRIGGEEAACWGVAGLGKGWEANLGAADLAVVGTGWGVASREVVEGWGAAG